MGDGPMAQPTHWDATRLLRTLGPIVFAALLIGCGGGERVYELELVPDGESLSRELIYSASPAVPEDEGEPSETEETGEQEISPEVKRLAAVFEADIPPHADGKYQFRKSFAGAMPDDVGGSGRFARKVTSVGSLYVYSERFRGSYELVNMLESRFEKLETLTDLLAHWVRTAGKESPLRDRLERVVEEDLRRDLKNALLLALMMSEDDSDDDAERFWMHLAQYFSERDYIDLDLILSGRWAGNSDAESLALLRRAIVLKLNLEDEVLLLQTWPALANAEDFEASLDEAVEMTEAYQQYAQQRSDDEKEPLPGSTMVGTLLWEVIGIDFGAWDSLTVYLKCPHEPLLTNGEWLPDEGRLHWNATLSARDSSSADAPPNLCYAVWSEPNSDFQQRHFGQVALEGESLANYCSWRASLHSREGAEWDQFLEGLTPADDLQNALSGFTFSEETVPRSPAAERIEEIYELFKAAF